MQEFEAREATLGAFIDYDNLLPVQKQGGILQLITKALSRTWNDLRFKRAKCQVRIYGGWYEGSQMTRSAQEIAIEIQRDFPAIIRVPVNDAGIAPIVVNSELAVSLLQEPGHHIFDTFRRKCKPGNVRVEQPCDIGCTDADCVLPQMARLLKSGECPKMGCQVAPRGLVYRHEQKIVDTMLCCDLMYAASTDHDCLLIVSSDDDFVPPIRSLLLTGSRIVRLHPKNNTQRPAITVGSAKLVEMDL